jgi:hypothetical protein
MLFTPRSIASVRAARYVFGHTICNALPLSWQLNGSLMLPRHLLSPLSKAVRSMAVTLR